MRSRGLVVAVAIVLAIVSGAAVILYTNSKTNGVSGGTDVVVSTQDIAANTNLNTLIDQSAFKVIKVPTDALVQGSVTDVEQLRDQTATQPILANEQISTSRLSSGTAVAGGTLGLDAGHVAVSLKVDGPSGVNGAITRGSYITVYATLQSVKLLKGGSPAAIINAATRPVSSSAPQAQELPSMTITLIPAVKVLDVVNPPLDATNHATAGSVVLTLDLTPTDAQNLVFAQSGGSIYLGLLPPGDTKGNSIPFSVVPINRVLGRAAP
jgi:Flp pilus assembly protein CpaB